jgi:hypothetical protein
MQLAPVIAADPNGCAWYHYDGATGGAGSCGTFEMQWFTSSPTEAASDIQNGFQCQNPVTNAFNSCAILCSAGVFDVPNLLGSAAPAPASTSQPH